MIYQNIGALNHHLERIQQYQSLLFKSFLQVVLINCPKSDLKHFSCLKEWLVFREVSFHLYLSKRARQILEFLKSFRHVLRSQRCLRLCLGSQ